MGIFFFLNLSMYVFIILYSSHCLVFRFIFGFFSPQLIWENYIDCQAQFVSMRCHLFAYDEWQIEKKQFIPYGFAAYMVSEPYLEIQYWFRFVLFYYQCEYSSSSMFETKTYRVRYKLITNVVSSSVILGFGSPPMENMSKFVAELIGTGLLMFGGCMGGLTWGKEPNSFFSALSFGMVVMTLVQAYSAVSGAHFNPAVTLAALLFKMISLPVSGNWLNESFTPPTLLTGVFCRWPVYTSLLNWPVPSLDTDYWKRSRHTRCSSRMLANMDFARPCHKVIWVHSKYLCTNTWQRCS